MATRQERIDWLLNNQSLWEGMPISASQFGTGRQSYSARLRPLFIAMRKAKLYSPSTRWTDAAILNLINAARMQRRAAIAKAETE